MEEGERKQEEQSKRSREKYIKRWKKKKKKTTHKIKQELTRCNSTLFFLWFQAYQDNNIQSIGEWSNHLSFMNGGKNDDVPSIHRQAGFLVLCIQHRTIMCNSRYHKP